MHPDVIIAGQGICGSLLSWSLLQKGLSVKVYDAAIEQSATYAASGIINPITGRRFVKSWMIDELIPEAESTYAELGQKLSINFYDKLPIYKVLESIKQRNDLSARASQTGYEQYFCNDGISFLDKEKVKNNFGAFVIDGGGKMDTQLFLKTYREFLQSNDLLVERPYTYDDAIKATCKVIFCDGYKAKKGLFKSLAWQIVKGEYLLVKIKDFYHDRIISGDTTISPTADKDIYYAGATYQWHYETKGPTTQYKNEIMASLDKMLTTPYEVMYHGAAIRPSAKYRRPFLGFHPQYNNVGIFNGMGTKGISLAPYFARHFAEHIADGTALLEEVDIKAAIQTR